MIKNVLKVSALVLVLGVASGCASQEAIDSGQCSKRCGSSQIYS